jgi:hypothetical protein
VLRALVLASVLLILADWRFRRARAGAQRRVRRRSPCRFYWLTTFGAGNGLFGWAARECSVTREALLEENRVRCAPRRSCCARSTQRLAALAADNVRLRELLELHGGASTSACS